jgi:hypothetical protein
MRNFKKVSIAAAVTTALGVAGTAQALTLGEPGEALLVPYALCDTNASVGQINTLVGITVPATLGGDPTPIGRDLSEGRLGSGYSTAPHVTGYNAGNGVSAAIPYGLPSDPQVENIHWYFFDRDSTPIIDDGLHATRNDYVPFDWCGKISELDAGNVADGVQGYLVFTNDPEVRSGAGFAMYGDAGLIQGNWESAAYIPVVPMADSEDDSLGLLACENEVMQGKSFPTDVSPLCAGTPTDNNNGIRDEAVLNVRYFSDPALNGGTDMVLWSDSNCNGSGLVVVVNPDGSLTGAVACDRRTLHLEVFDTEEEHNSATVDLSHELNVLDPETIAGTHHTDSGPLGNGLVNQGYLQVVLPEIVDPGALNSDGPRSSVVSFALIHFGTSSNAAQVQTALAQERGIW